MTDWAPVMILSAAGLVTAAALWALEPGPTNDAPLLDPDCRDEKHGSCVGGPCECWCHEPGEGLRLMEPPEQGGEP
jgi:hypothetical protein